MNPRLPSAAVVCRLIAASLALLLSPLVGSAAPVKPLSADVIMQKTLERAQSSLARDAHSHYVYDKHTVTEDLDLKGKIKDRKEKLYEVTVDNGLSYLKLLQVNGEKLSPSELRKEEDRENTERQRMQDSKSSTKGDNRENFLTPELVAKYNYTLNDQITFNGRPTYVITFEPKPGLAVHSLTDRFANELGGTVYIDVADFEIAHAQIHLRNEVTLWGGVIGTLRHCRFTMERTRLPDGIWFNSSSHGIFEGRKLIEPMLIRTKSESTNFHRPALAME